MPEYNRKPVFPIVMVAAGVVLILGALFWSVSMGQAPQQVASVPVASSDTGEQAGLTPRIPFPNITRVAVDEAKSAFDANQAVFIDTRGDPYFSSGHIPGAISMTADETLSRLGELDRSRWIITYCT